MHVNSLDLRQSYLVGDNSTAAGGLEMDFKVPSDPNHFMLLDSWRK